MCRQLYRTSRRKAHTLTFTNDKGRYHSGDCLGREIGLMLLHPNLFLERAFHKIVLDTPMDKAHVTVSRDDETASGSLRKQFGYSVRITTLAQHCIGKL